MAGSGLLTALPSRANRHARLGAYTVRANDREMSQICGATFATPATNAGCLCSVLKKSQESQAPTAEFDPILVRTAPRPSRIVRKFNIQGPPGRQLRLLRQTHRYFCFVLKMSQKSQMSPS